MKWPPSPVGHRPTDARHAVTAGRPAYLLNRDHHGAWVNTAALHRAGIDRNTGPTRRASNGTAPEIPAERCTKRHAPDGAPPAPALRGRLPGRAVGRRYLHARGVTFWHDAIIGRYLGYDDTLDIYREADRRGR